MKKIIMLFVVLFLSSCNSKKEIEDFVNKSLQVDKELNLNTFDLFEWDSILILNPYSNIEKTEIEHNLNLNNVSQSIEMLDNINLLIFLKGNKSVNYVEIHRNLGDFNNYNEIILKQESIFFVDDKEIILITSTKNVVDNFKTKNFDVAIFPEEYVDFISEKRFTPTKEEVLKAEKALETKLEIINKDLINQSSSPIIHKNLKKYKRQYFGCYDKQGRKYLLINAFWGGGNIEQGWLDGWIIVLDGGSYYWNIKYYIEEDELKDLSVNGYA